MFTALLDTSILWLSTQRDFLLSLAAEGLYRPIWSAAILAELEWHESAKLRRAFDDAEVDGWEGLEGSYGLPDPDDEHVVAAGEVGGAGVIVTLNRKDFPAERVPGGIEVLSPAVFAYNTVLLDPAAGLRAVEEISARSGTRGRPRRTIDGILDTLARRYDMDDTVGILRDAATASS